MNKEELHEARSEERERENEEGMKKGKKERREEMKKGKEERVMGGKGWCQLLEKVFWSLQESGRDQ